MLAPSNLPEPFPIFSNDVAAARRKFFRHYVFFMLQRRRLLGDARFSRVSKRMTGFTLHAIQTLVK
jgi:hypothetical protein